MEEKEIDLLDLASRLWDQRRKLIKWSICGAVIGLVVAFSILARICYISNTCPESNVRNCPAEAWALSHRWLESSTGAEAGMDAVYPMLYPDVVSSVPFITSLFDVEITTKKDGKKMTVQQFMEDETSAPWWSVILGLPGKLIGLLKSVDEADENHKLDSFQLTQNESLLVEALNQRISAAVDAKTSVVD